jgi:membrane-associated protease RseP (regulator of RpoE activity)
VGLILTPHTASKSRDHCHLRASPMWGRIQHQAGSEYKDVLLVVQRYSWYNLVYLNQDGSWIWSKGKVMEPFVVAYDDVVSHLQAELTDIMAVSKVTVSSGGARELEFSGRLLCEADAALERLLTRFERYGYTPFLRRRGEQDMVLAHPGLVRPKPANPWINLILFIITVFTTLLLGALNEGADLLRNPLSIAAGVPFSFALMAILSTHELGHYFVARRRGVAVTLPYFIPMPLSPIGTMGAFIQLRSPVHNKRGLLDVGLAGPFSGLIVAIPVLVYGLARSPVEPIKVGPQYFQEGNSLLYLALKYLVHGRILPGGGMDVYIGPVAFAGWLGILVTALNLLPAGQLDGGHIIYALLGDLARPVAMATLLALAGMGIFLWNGWLIWAVLIFFFGIGHPAPLDDITPLDFKRKLLGALAVLVFIMVFTPVPFS